MIGSLASVFGFLFTLDFKKILSSKEFQWFVSTMINLLFIILWVGVQYAVHEVLDFLSIDGMNDKVANIFRAIFAISTFSVVAIYIYSDIKIYFIQRKKQQFDNEYNKEENTSHNNV